MKASLKQRVKDHFECYSLPAEELEKFYALQQVPVRTLRSRRVSLWISAAALTALLAVVVPSFYFVIYRTASPVVTLDEFARDIAYHHNKRMSLEIESSSLSDVRAFFQKLDFAIIQSDKLPISGWEMLGGRYCTVKGVLAAQLRVREKSTGKTYTYYQATFPKELKQLSGVFQTDALGAHVEMWGERGLLLALAGDN